MLSSNPMLTVHGVSKSYQTTPALKAVTFELNAGFNTLLGPNGAGKSTLFQILTGLFTPDQGDINILNIDIRNQLTQALAHIGVVFQQSALDLDLTVYANLRFHGRLHGLSDKVIQARITPELAKLDLESLLNKPCRTLSGGNRRKVELVRALMTHPSVLLMDEATVGLDPVSRDSLIKHVHQLCHERDLCVLWATHLIDEAETADQVLILHKGELLQQASPQQLINLTNTDHLLEAFLQLSGYSLPKPSKALS